MDADHGPADPGQEQEVRARFWCPAVVALESADLRSGSPSGS